MKKLLFSTLFILPLILHAQSKHDYNWLMGVEQDPSPDYPINCMNMLSFDGGELSIEKLSVEYPLYVANTSMSDNNGNLLFYSNGCDVKDANHQVMPNGEDLNPGILYDSNCPDGGYSTMGGIIALPQANDTNEYFLIHQAGEVFNTSPYLRVNRLYFTKIDMALNNGYGDVTVKNQPILNSQIQVGIQAVKHSNNQDWWVMAMSLNEDKYYKILLTENGISEVDSQQIGEVLSFNGGGQMAFSPDGTKFAKYDFMDQLMLFDFDRSTGLLSNYQKMEIDTNELAFCGLAFSPNSKRLYVSTQTKLWQLDLEAPELPTSQLLIAEWDSFYYEFFNFLFPVTFQRMQLGPDCRIYMTSHGPVAYMHVINNPDEPGLACNFVQRGLELPCSVNYSIPNFPNYRLGTGYPVCDSSIVYVPSGYVPLPAAELRVWPNPAGSELHVARGAYPTAPATLRLFDATGRAVRQWELSAAGERVLSLEGLADGLYFWRLASEGRQLKGGKLVILK